MPIGIIANVLSVAVGGLIGAAAGNKLSASFKENLNLVFGACALTMGVSSITLMENMPAVIFSVIIGTCIGLTLKLGAWVNRGAALMQRAISRFAPRPAGISQEEFDAELLTVIVLFCASGTGIYGSIVSGISGDHSILLAKSVLDLFTALIFACSLGAVTAVIALPQCAVFLTLYALAGLIYPLCTPAMINDFKACGGVLLLATGFRMMKLRAFPLADMLPAMVLVMPVSYLWVSCVLPLL